MRVEDLERDRRGVAPAAAVVGAERRGEPEEAVHLVRGRVMLVLALGLGLGLGPGLGLG